MKKVLAIDLDDTLFSELDYVKSGFTKVAEQIAFRNSHSVGDVLNQILYQFLKYGRAGVFNRTMSHFGFSAPDINELVETYRTHDPAIVLFNDVPDALEKLNTKFRVIVVTDGFAPVQRRKIKALGLDAMVEKVVYCMDYNSPKPSPVPYLTAANELAFNIKDMIILGDDPYCDMRAATNLGIPSYRVMTGKYTMVKSLPRAMPKMEFDSIKMATKYLMVNDDE